MKITTKIYTVKPPRRDRIGDGMFVPCREVGPISEVLFVMVFLGENEEITMKQKLILKSEGLELNEIMKSGLFCSGYLYCTADKLSIKLPTCIAYCKCPQDSRKS